MRSDSGTKFVYEVPGKIVAMVEHEGQIFVATEHQIFRLINGVLKPLMFGVAAESCDE